MAQRKTIVDDQRPGLLDVWFQKFEKTFVKKSCEEKCKKTSTIFLVFWMSNAEKWGTMTHRKTIVDGDQIVDSFGYWRYGQKFAIFNKPGELTKHIQQIHPIPF